MKVCSNKGDVIKGEQITFQCRKTPKLDKNPKKGSSAHRIHGGTLEGDVFCVIDKLRGPRKRMKTI